MAPDPCEIARLPEDVLSAVLSRASPRDACRAAAVSPAFRAAADSDAIWSHRLPRQPKSNGELTPFADGELPPATMSSKELFLRLSASPVLLPDGLVSMWLDRETGTKCYMLSARDLVIIWGGTRRYWEWIPITDSRFSEGAHLISVCWLEIRGKIHTNMLSQNTTYSAYMVFKMHDHYYGLDHPFQEASVSVGETRSTSQVCLNYEEEAETDVPENYRPLRPLWRHRNRRRNPDVARENVAVPRRRADGWMELALGEFFNQDGEDSEVFISLVETRGGHWKRGLIVQGIEIRLKKAG